MSDQLIVQTHNSGRKLLGEFKLIIAGGRDFSDELMFQKELTELVNSMPDTSVVSIVSGMARGADAIGASFAKQHGIQLYEFPADWHTNGKRAGYLRNEEMADFADGLLAFWDGESRGTAHMIQAMYDRKKPVSVARY